MDSRQAGEPAALAEGKSGRTRSTDPEHQHGACACSPVVPEPPSAPLAPSCRLRRLAG